MRSLKFKYSVYELEKSNKKSLIYSEFDFILMKLQLQIELL